MPKFDDLDDDEKEEKAKIMAADAAKAKEKARVALEVQAQREEQKAKENEAAKAAEAKAWEEAKAAAAAREAQKAANEDKAKGELTPGQLVLQAIDTLAIQVAESDEHVQRCERLQKVGSTLIQLHMRIRASIPRCTREAQRTSSCIFVMPTLYSRAYLARALAPTVRRFWATLRPRCGSVRERSRRISRSSSTS